MFSHPWAHSQLCASGPAKNNGFYRGAGKRKSADTVGHPGTQTHGGTTWGQNGILILNNPHYTYIYVYIQFIFGIYINHVVETPETHKCDPGDNN